MKTGEGKSVLVVEDDVDIRSALAIYLHRIGFEVHEAANGRLGLEKIARQTFDIVISDIMMPEIGGLQFLEELKKARPTVDVIMITGYGDMNVAIEAMKLGAADFVTKPFQFEYLEGIIKGILTRRASMPSFADKDIQNLQNHLERKIQEISNLYSIGEALDNIDGSDELFTKLCELSVKICGASAAAYYLVGQDRNKLTLLKTYPESAAAGRPVSLSLPDEIAFHLDSLNEPLNIHDAAAPAFLLKILGDREGAATSAILAPFFVRREYFGLLCLNGKVAEPKFTDTDVTFIKMLLKKAGLAIENTALYETIYNNLVSTLRSLVSTIEAKDPYTRYHSSRVTQLGVLIGREMGCSPEEISTLQFAGMLHDIGKIGVSDAVLLKQGSLTKEEFLLIKEHPVIGSRILEPIGMLPQENAIIRHHHERWDGKGYPDGLGGKDIPLLVRILTIADSYDAMTSDRVYRRGLPHSSAVAEITRNSWQQFDGNIVKAFISLCRKHNDNLLDFLRNDPNVLQAS